MSPECPGAHDEASEQSEPKTKAAPAGEHSEASEPVGEEQGEDEEENEELLGVNLESTPLVVLAIVGSLALALGVWLRPGDRRLLALVAVTLLAFCALDIREVVHQVDESNDDIAIVAALHLSVAVLGGITGT